MARPYFANPMFAQGLSNLAEALFPSDEERLKMANLGAQRQLLESQRRKYDADATASELKTREQERLIEEQNAATEALIGVLGLDPAGAPALNSIGRQGVLGGNAQQSAAGLTELLSAMMAVGGEDQRRSARILQGGQLDEDFAGTTSRADAVAGRNASNDRRIESMRQSGATERERIAQAGQNYRSVYDTVFERMFDAQVPPAAGARKGGGGGAALDINGTDANAIVDQIALLANTVPANYERKLDPQTQQRIAVRASQLYQQTRNLPAAVQAAWQEIMGASGPQIVDETQWFGPDTSTISAPPPAAAPAAAAPAAAAPRRRYNPATGRIETY